MRMMSCVRMMSHECERVHENCNIIPLLASEVPTKDSKVSIWFSHNVGESIVVIVKDRIFANFVNEMFKELLFFSLFAPFPRRKDRNGCCEASSFGFLDHLRSSSV